MSKLNFSQISDIFNCLCINGRSHNGKLYRSIEKSCDIIQIQPDKIIPDFKRAERNALEIFPGIKIIGYFFHYSKIYITVKENNAHNNKHVHFTYIAFLLQTLL
jgi:hypothetical protein